jgi:hypothetical protein
VRLQQAVEIGGEGLRVVLFWLHHISLLNS